MLGLAAMITLSTTCFGNDLDDGISVDGDIEHSDSIKTDVNASFIRRSARGKALTGAGGISNKTFKNGSTNVVGGAYFGKGSTIKGPVTVIFDGKNITNYGF
jgi:hypothetical protein